MDGAVSVASDAATLLVTPVNSETIEIGPMVITPFEVEGVTVFASKVKSSHDKMDSCR
jgi:hypothetical protein